MKKLFTSFFLLIFILAACSHENSLDRRVSVRGTTVVMKENIASDFIPSSYTIVSIGDSLTQGVGDSTKRGGYVPYLEDKLEEEKSVKDVVIHNYGVSGNRTSQVLNRLKSKEVKGTVKEADIVMITTGGNDIMKVARENFSTLELRDFDQEIMNYKKTLTTLMNTIKKENSDAVVVLIGLYNPFYPYFEDVKELDIVVQKWNDTSKAVLANYDHTLFVDVAKEFKEGGESLLYTDYFHPNDKGYELMADKAFSVLKEEALDILTDQKYLALKRENEQND